MVSSRLKSTACDVRRACVTRASRGVRHAACVRVLTARNSFSLSSTSPGPWIVKRAAASELTPRARQWMLFACPVTQASTAVTTDTAAAGRPRRTEEIGDGPTRDDLLIYYLSLNQVIFIVNLNAVSRFDS